MRNFLAYLLSLLFLFMPLVAQGALTDNIVSYWQFDEGSGTTASDATGNGNNGTLENSPTWTSGVIGDALQYNGFDQFVQTATNYGNASALATTTISAWFNTTSTAANQAIIELNPNPDGSSASSNFDVYLYSGVVFIHMWDGTAHYVQSPSSYNDGKWHMATVVFSTGLMTLYIDGTSVATSSIGTPCTTSCFSNSYWVIGRDAGLSNTAYFTGAIDEIGVWSRALSPAEIIELYNSGAGCPYSFGACSPAAGRIIRLRGGLRLIGGIRLGGTSPVPSGY